MKKKALTVAAIIAIVMAGGIGFGISLTYKAIDKIDKLEDKVSEYATKEEDKEKQGSQYVTIAGQYKITDTSAISDAYISGDDSALTDDKDKETLEMASAILKKITNDKMTNYEKELAVHDWMAENISFDSTSLAAIPGSTEFVYKPYGVLKYKNAVCVGYATTFKMFMNMLGMDCMVVHDKELSHSWDLVELEKDEWYYVDVTFDAGKKAGHTNFNLTQSKFASSHEFYTDGLPLADSTTYSYAAQNAVKETDIMKIPQKIKDALENNKTDIYFNVGVLSIEKTKEINSVMKAIVARINCNEENISAEVASASGKGGEIIIGISLSYMTDEEEGQNITNEKLRNLVNKLFGEVDSYDDEYIAG